MAKKISTPAVEKKIEQILQPTRTWDKEFAETAAKQAEGEFDPTWTAVEVRAWWFKFYMACGHKALGRILLVAAK